MEAAPNSSRGYARAPQVTKYRKRAASEIRVLLVEDDRPLAESTAAVLAAVGWRVDVAHDGESAVAATREQTYDVLLLDLQMPGMGGLAALRHIRTLPTPPRVLVVSAHLDAESVGAALRAGAADILEKPVDLRELVAILDGYVRASNPGAGPTDTPARESTDAASLVPEILGDSPAIRLVREQIVNVSRYKDMPVLVIGETGTGKELVAQAIHRLSGRSGSLYEINCAAVPEELFESEVFGHEAGSFTGAKAPRIGLFEAAGRGTVFLDEVGEMPAPLQAKLLRVLENRNFRRVGSNRTIDLQARIVSATNRSLRGRPGDALRSDLFFRLAGYTIRTPPLREHMEDIGALAKELLRRFAEENAPASTEISPRAIDALHAHHWPGNVRELRSVIHYACARADGGVIGVREIVEALRARGFEEDPPTRDLIPEPPPADRPSTFRLREMERDVITKTYSESNGNLSLAAQRLGIPRTTLRDKLKRYGLR